MPDACNKCLHHLYLIPFFVNKKRNACALMVEGKIVEVHQYIG